MMQYNRTAAATAWDWVGGTRDTVWQSPWTSLGVLDSMISVCLCVFLIAALWSCSLSGVCLGMQVAVIEFARNVLGWGSKSHTYKCLLSLQPNPMLLLLLSCCIASCGTLEYNNNRTSVGLGWRDKDTAARQPSIMTQVLIWCSDLKSSICVQNHSLSIRW